MSRTSRYHDAVLDFILLYMKENGVSPSYREIMDEVGMKSTSAVHNSLRVLKDRGQINFQRYKARSITLTKYRFEMVQI